MTTTTAVSSTPSNSSTSSILSGQASSFGDNPFLKLLTAQLQNQTPLEPVDNASFMNQMASYSAIEQQQSLNKNLQQLLDYQGLLARMQGLSQGSTLLGKQVTYDTDTDKGLQGVVRSIYVADSGDVHLKLDNGKDVDMRAVTAIANGTSTGAGSTGSGNGSASGSSTSSTGSTGSGSGGS